MSAPDQKKMQKRLRKLLELPENQVCLDCGDNKPTWASLIVEPPDSIFPGSMGAFCCFHCSGAHRRLGTHICFVRSITLDDWKEKEVEIMERGGNKRVNAAFEARLKVDKPQKDACLETRDAYVKAKYRERDFFDKKKYKPGPAAHTEQKVVDLFDGFGDEDLFSNSKQHLFDLEDDIPFQNSIENDGVQFGTYKQLSETIVPLRDEEDGNHRKKETGSNSRSRSRSSTDTRRKSQPQLEERSDNDGNGGAETAGKRQSRASNSSCPGQSRRSRRSRSSDRIAEEGSCHRSQSSDRTERKDDRKERRESINSTASREQDIGKRRSSRSSHGKSGDDLSRSRHSTASSRSGGDLSRSRHSKSDLSRSRHSKSSDGDDLPRNRNSTSRPPSRVPVPPRPRDHRNSNEARKAGSRSSSPTSGQDKAKLSSRSSHGELGSSRHQRRTSSSRSSGSAEHSKETKSSEQEKTRDINLKDRNEPKRKTLRSTRSADLSMMAGLSRPERPRRERSTSSDKDSLSRQSEHVPRERRGSVSERSSSSGVQRGMRKSTSGDLSSLRRTSSRTSSAPSSNDSDALRRRSKGLSRARSCAQVGKSQSCEDFGGMGLGSDPRKPPRRTASSAKLAKSKTISTRNLSTLTEKVASDLQSAAFTSEVNKAERDAMFASDDGTALTDSASFSGESQELSDR